MVWTLKHRRTEEDVQAETQRLQLARARLAGVLYEHEQTEKKRAAYLELKAKLKAAAAYHVAGLIASGSLDESDADMARAQVLDRMACEAEPSNPDGKATSFAAEELPQRMSAAHILDAAVDEVSGLPVDHLPGLDTSPLGTAFAAAFRTDMEAVAVLLAERMDDGLSKTMAKTVHARGKAGADPALLLYSSGQKLAQDLTTAKDVKKALAARRAASLRAGPISRAFGVFLSPAGAAEGGFLSRRTEARAMLRSVRRQQQSRLVRLLMMLSPSTIGYLLISYASTSLNGVWSALHTSLLADAASHATLPDGAWQGAVGRDILAFTIIFVIEWWLNDFVSIVACNKSNADFTRRIRNSLFDAIMRQDTVYFELNDSGAVCDRLNSDCGRVAESFLHLPREIIGIASRLVATGALLYFRCPPMLYRAAAFAVLAAPLIVLMQRAVNDLAHKGHRALRVTGRATNEMLRNLGTVREFGREGQESEAYARMQTSQARDGMKLRLLQHLQWPIFISVFFTGQLANLWAGAALVNAGTLSAIELVQLFHQFGELTHCFKHLVDQLPRLLELLIPADRVFTILESKSCVEPNEGDAPRTPFEAHGGGVAFTFEGVSFAYPTMPEHRVLRGLSLHVPAGKTVALVGERGCGKSTTVELMKRAYDAEDGCGRVLVNGAPMQSWDVRSFRRRIAVVSQSVHLFGGSIRDNILYGLTPEERRARGFDGAEGEAARAAEAELQRVTAMAGCDFIADYPLKLETRLGTGGIKLSGGQKQCIAIARALIKRPALLILDEATSALDAKTQAHVATAIAAEQARLGFTVVQIAHRLETLRDSDLIYFFSHGRVVEAAGEHSLNRCAVDELLKVPIVMKSVRDAASGKLTKRVRKGFFHDMWNRAHGKVPYGEMGNEALAAKACELRLEIAAVEAALRQKAARRRMCVRLLAVRALLRRHDGERGAQIWRWEAGGAWEPRKHARFCWLPR